ncbi:MAG: hypothetical protein FWE80_06785 [Oscillospiraceae bacterium]|nr:hypothetical protein [Oscillospiraceae bacterium]
MAEISTNIILDGITLAIRAEYPDCQIFTDEVEQGLNPGDFIVLLLDANKDREIGPRYTLSTLFDIHYFPKSENDPTNINKDCYAVADQLEAALELITLPTGDPLRGTGMNWEVVDGVLHFFVSYAPRYFRPTDDGDPMQEFNYTPSVV